MRQRDFAKNASLSFANWVSAPEMIDTDGTINFSVVNPLIGNRSCR